MFTYRLVGADVNTMKDCAANRVKAIDDEILIKESGKLRFLVQLMARLKQEGHRTLIFSLSRKMLDIIQKVSGIQAVVILGIVCVESWEHQHVSQHYPVFCTKYIFIGLHPKMCF